MWVEWNPETSVVGRSRQTYPTKVWDADASNYIIITSEAEANSAGWYEYVDEPKPDDSLLSDGGVDTKWIHDAPALVGNQVVRSWSESPKTAADYEREAREAKAFTVAGSIDVARQWAADYRAAGPTTQSNALGRIDQMLDRDAKFFDFFADFLEAIRWGEGTGS